MGDRIIICTNCTDQKSNLGEFILCGEVKLPLALLEAYNLLAPQGAPLLILSVGSITLCALLLALDGEYIRAPLENLSLKE